MRNRFRLHHLLWILPVALVVVAAACGGATATSPTAATAMTPNSGSTPGSGSVPTSGTAGSGAGGIGTLSVMIKDSPFSEATALLVTFSEVSAHMSGTDTTDGEWVTLPFAAAATSRTCDLKRLVAATDVLGTASLAAGH